MRDKSLPISAAKLYNSLPYHIRNLDSDSYDEFKKLLDEFLSSVPDQPNVPGLVTCNMNNEVRPSNSLIDWNCNLRNSSWTPSTLQSVPSNPV